MRFNTAVPLEEKPLAQSTVIYAYTPVQKAWVRNLRGLGFSGPTIKRPHHLYNGASFCKPYRSRFNCSVLRHVTQF